MLRYCPKGNSEKVYPKLSAEEGKCWGAVSLKNSAVMSRALDKAHSKAITSYNQ